MTLTDICEAFHKKKYPFNDQSDAYDLERELTPVMDDVASEKINDFTRPIWNLLSTSSDKSLRDDIRHLLR